MEDTDILAPDRDPALNPDLDRLSRRSFLERAGVGAAVAAGLSASANAAPRALEDPTLRREDITYPSRFGGKETQVKALLVRPEHETKRGAVIVIHEIFGLTDHIRDVACRVAQAGYTAFAPDLFTREGPAPPLSGGFEPLMKFATGITDAQILADLDAGIHLLRARNDSNGKVGSVGFCWGGRTSMLLDAHAPRLNAAVAYYGRITGPKTPNQPTHPLDVAAHFHAPLLGNFGGKDTSIPPADVEKLREAMKAHHKVGELHNYEEAGHAFNNDTRESYNPEAAAMAWKRTLAWFHKYLAS